MTRTQTISPGARQRRSYEVLRRERQGTSQSTRRDVRHPDHAQQPGASRGERLFVHRQAIGTHSIETDLFLAVLRGLPQPNTAYTLQKHTKGRDLFVPMLSKQGITTYQDAFAGTIPRPMNYLRQQLEQKAPDSFANALGSVPVKDVIEIGPTHARAVALELDSSEMQAEIASFAKTIDGLHEYSVDKYHDLPVPHITIASFPGRNTVPSSVISAIEDTAPECINIGEGRFTA